MRRTTLLLLALAILLPCFLPWGTMDVRWEGSTDYDMLKRVRSDIDEAKARNMHKLRVALASPGGPVLTSLEIARTVREASDRGLIIEMHAAAICASGCTFLLAAGTPGFRHINSDTLFLVHSIQSGSPFGGTQCLSYVPRPREQDEKMIDTLLVLMAKAYSQYTGSSAYTALTWFVCGNEQIGAGAMAQRLGFADVVE